MGPQSGALGTKESVPNELSALDYLGWFVLQQLRSGSGPKPMAGPPTLSGNITVSECRNFAFLAS